MATLFTKIAKGEIPSYKIAEDDRFYAFLDIFPLKKGHTLVIPKHVEDDYLFNLDDKTYAELLLFSKKVAKAIEKTISCKRIALAVMGMEVPHTHIHLVPIDKESDMNLSNPKLKLTPEEMTQIAEDIRKNF